MKKWWLALLFWLTPRLASGQAVIAASGYSVHPLGVVLSGPAFYGPAVDYTQNLLANPGFEPTTSGRVVVVPSGSLSSTTFCDSTDGANQPAGFYDGATFEDIYVSGSTASVRGTGTITGYTVTGTPCASGSTFPEYTYSASFTIVAGDYIRFSGTGNVGGESTYAPSAWWNSDANITIVSDEEPSGSGVQSIAFGLNGSSHVITSFIDATQSSYTGSSINYLKVSGPYTMSCWAKAVGASSPSLNLTFSRSSTTFDNQTFTPTTSWAQYSYAFTGSETSLTSNVGVAQFTVTGNGASGSIHVDDCFVGPTTPSAGSWMPDLTRNLSTLNPGSIRMQQGVDGGNSYANYIANDSARGPWTTLGGSGEWGYNLDQFFQLNYYLGTIPWINIPVVLTTGQYNSLGAYLASEEAIYSFPQILVEWGNEEWNAVQCQATCYSTAGGVYSAVEQHDFAAVESGAGSPSWLKPVGAGQYEVAGGTGQLQTVLANVTSAAYTAGAPYYLNSLTYSGSIASDMTALFAAVQSAASYKTDNSLSVPITLYEGGPNTYSTPSASATPAPQSNVNDVIAGAGSATSDGFNTLNAWSGDIPIQNEFQLGQLVYQGNSPYTAGDIWGIVSNLPNSLFRPRGLAMQLLNNYCVQNSSGTLYPTSSTTYTSGNIGNSGATVVAWKSGSGVWNVCIANTSASSQNIVIQWGSAQTNLPTGTVKQINFASTIEDTNENGTVNVTLGNGGTVTNNSSTEITVPVPAYGLVVASGVAVAPGNANTNPASMLMSER